MPATKKLDLYKLHKDEYITPKKPLLLKVKPANYLAIDGKGAPSSEEFQNKIGALYSVAFTLNMAKKFAGQDYRVCHLEALWWGSREGGDFVNEPPSTWNYKLLIRVPDFIKKKDVAAAVKQVKDKGRPVPVAQVQLETIREGQCVQMLHVGPYSNEGETIAQMMQLASEKGLTCHGRHHEIYFSDPRRVPPERLRTILRFPVQ